ncbi:hypothetical protein C0995_008853 [Termitomyces sp. Mi166|nr:hypothetical protein C0995_008853 [Termitomyces sp. Mi166\
MSRQSTPDPPQGNSLSPGSSPIGQGDLSEQPSTSSRRRTSKDSEGYPSWLPGRPLPPAPASTFHSSVGVSESSPLEAPPFVGGRKPTPRSVRIVSLQDSRREPTDQNCATNNNNTRVWSKTAGASVPPPMPSGALDAPRAPQPKFHSRNANLDLLRNPTLKFHLYFYLYPLLIFAHIPLQTFFDFNAFPNPQAPGVPSSGKNWALGAAAYIACWFVWILVYIRFSAFAGENGSLRDGLAETFWFYSQNLPTVALLLPRAGLTLGLLLSFSTPQVGEIALTDAGIHLRDSTFFRTADGTLTNYARGVLIANAAWTAWRALVLITSWIGLWIVSGQGCAGLCGPRYRWEEEEAEKRRSYYSDEVSLDDTIQWSWRECTRMRIQDAYNFCLTLRPSSTWNRKEASGTALGANGDGEMPDDMEQVLAAIGLPSVPPPARRGALSGDLFESPQDESSVPPTDISQVIPKVAKRSSKDKQVAGPSAPPTSLPYPFTAAGACVSSSDRVPFPPSPVPTGSKKTGSPSGRTGSGSGSSVTTTEDEEDEEEEDEDDEEEEEEDDEDEDEEEEDEDEDEDEDEEPSSGRGSESMSSLGQPVASRYPFQYRRPGRGTSISSGAASHQTPTSLSRSMQSKASRGTQSTGYRESSDSHSPRSQYSTSDAAISSSSGIPMPPRHPQQGQKRGRQRAGTVPALMPASVPSIVFPTTSRPRAHVRADSGSLGAGSDDGHSLLDDAGSEESHEAAEREDLVGLLSSPGSSLRNRGSTISQNRLHGSRSSSNSRSNSRSNSHASSSRSRAPSFSVVSIRTRAQSLMQNIGAASQSSLELVQTVIRSRANSSTARLEEDSYYSDGRTHSSSASRSVSPNENYTFGQPMRMHFPVREQGRLEEEPSTPEPDPESEPRRLPLHHSASNFSFAGPQPSYSSSQFSAQSQRQPSTDPETAATSRALSTPAADFATSGPSSPVEIPRSPIRATGHPTDSATSSPPDISTAPGSFITAPATIEGTTESSGRTISSWGDLSHMVDRPDATWRPA